MTLVFQLFRRLALLAVLLVSGGAALAAGLPTATGGRVIGDDARSRFVLDLDRAVDISAFTLASPYRVVVDMPAIVFDLPDGAGDSGRGLLTGWRYGLFMPGRSRVVLDAAGPVKIDQAVVQPAADGEPARLVLDVSSTSEADFAAGLAASEEARERANGPSSPPGDAPATLPDDGRTKPLVVIDPGHGGVDSGTIAGDGALEKDVVLAFAKALRDKIEATGRVAVLLTRDDDNFLPLNDRVRFARDHRADLFLSIHADSEHEGSVRGATVYTLSDRASDRQAAALADKENASDLVAGLDPAETPDGVTDILVDLTRRETRSFSHAFAGSLIDDLTPVTKLIRNPNRSAGFRVLTAHDVPSLLIELGYLSNGDDEKLLTSDDWRQRVAGTVAQSVLRFLGPRYAASQR